jgi:mannose-6-phosphate isomerase-like protein (cupin superfamily)
VRFRRVVTMVDGDGRSVVVEDADLPGARVGMLPGREFRVVWGADDHPIAAASSLDPVLAPFFPPIDGNRWGLVTYAPEPADEAAVRPDPTPAQLAEAQAVVPGLVTTYETASPGMHTTATVDYGFVVEGELTLELDDGVRVALPTGTCVVQNGTRHKWRNLGSTPATLLYVMLGAAPDGSTTD